MNRFKILNIAGVIFNVLLLVFLFCCFSFTTDFTVNAASKEIQSLNTNNPDLIQGKGMFIKARRMFYNAEAPFNTAKDLLNSSSESFNKLPDGYEKYYWLAQSEFEAAEIAEYSGDPKQAAKNFTDSNNLVRKALDINSKYSDSNRLLADTIMRLMKYNGAMYMMSQGPQALKLLNNAISLDKYNYTAMNSLGIYYINAPAIGGGNVDKGIKTLEKALESKDEFDNFITDTWLGTAYQKKKDSMETVKRYKKALEIYPNSPWVRGLLKGIEGQR